MTCSLVVGTRADLESSGHLLHGEVHLNGCCRFPTWRRGGDMVVQVTSRCRRCLAGIRAVLADPNQTQLLGSGKVQLAFQPPDPAAPLTPILRMPSGRIVAQ